MQTVLLVESDRALRDLLQRYLEKAGLSVLTSATGVCALASLETEHPDLLLLDLGLPDIDGWEVLAVARRRTPVVVLSSHCSTNDRIAGLRSGAEDYIGKPFNPTEVVLRVLTVLGRERRVRDHRGPRSYGDGILVVDTRRREATVAGTTLQLTPSEWGLLETLVSSPGRVYHRHELCRRITTTACDSDERSIDSHVKNLRHKLGEPGSVIVQTVVGVGYRLGVRPDS